MDQAAEILWNLVCFAFKQSLVDFVSVPPIGHRSMGGGWREVGGGGGLGELQPPLRIINNFLLFYHGQLLD